jgi:hypothetical protein
MKNATWNLIVSSAVLLILVIDKLLLSPLWKRKSELIEDQCKVYNDIKSAYEINKKDFAERQAKTLEMIGGLQKGEQTKETRLQETYQLLFFAGFITQSIGYLPIVEAAANKMQPSISKTFILEGIKQRKMEIYTNIAQLSNKIPSETRPDNQ